MANKWSKDGSNVDSGSGSKKGSSGKDSLKGTGSVDRHEKTHDVEFAEGGDTHMFSEQQASPQTPAKTGKNGATGKGAEFAAGGKTPMFGFTGALPQEGGRTSAR